MSAIKKTKGEITFDVINIVFLLFISLLMIYPILYVVFASFSDATEFVKHTGLMYGPIKPTGIAYKMVSENPMIFRGYLNTLFIVVVGVTLSVLLTAIGAYFLTRKDVKLQKPIMILILITMFFSGGMIPFYFTVKDLHIDNTLWSLIFPTAINTFNLIIMKSSFESIPDSLDESAQIDGAGHFTRLFRIIIPVSQAVMAVMILYYAVSQWNSWFNAMLFINDREKFPLQLILREILISNDTDVMTQSVDSANTAFLSETIKYAVIVVATVPILVVYPFLQKYFVKGVMIGSVKG